MLCTDLPGVAAVPFLQCVFGGGLFCFIALFLTQFYSGLHVSFYILFVFMDFLELGSYNKFE